MIAANTNGGTTATSSIQTGEKELGVEVVYFSHNLGITFKDNNGIANNDALLEMLGKANADEITKENGLTTFPVKHSEFAHFLHLLYCATSDAMKVRVEFDGLFPFDAPDEQGVVRKFNAQLVTISEVLAD
jgi:hypothetical protein